MNQILVYQSLEPKSLPVRFQDVFTAAEFLFREHAEAVVLPLPTLDCEAQDALHLLSGLPLAEPPRLYITTDRPIEFPLPEQVSYCFHGPIEEERVSQFLRSYRDDSILPYVDARRMDRYCSEMLLHLGVAPNLQGFEMLRLAILYLLHAPEPTKIRMIDELYPAVAFKMGTTRANVEHSMRTAIETAWLRTDLETIEAFFGYTTKFTKSTPSNAAFLYALTDRIRLQLSDRTDAILAEIRRLESKIEP